MPVNYQQHRIGIYRMAPFKQIIIRKSTYNYNPMYLKLNFKLLLLIIMLQYHSNHDAYEQSQLNCKNNLKINCNIELNTKIENNYDKIKQNKHNNLLKLINGNKTNFNKIKLMQYNKGNSNFENHIHHLQNVIQVHSPSIMCISEANINLNI